LIWSIIVVQRPWWQQAYVYMRRVISYTTGDGATARQAILNLEIRDGLLFTGAILRQKS
jgi:hypothetical protein